MSRSAMNAIEWQQVYPMDYYAKEGNSGQTITNQAIAIDWTAQQYSFVGLLRESANRKETI